MALVVCPGALCAGLAVAPKAAGAWYRQPPMLLTGSGLTESGTVGSCVCVSAECV